MQGLTSTDGVVRGAEAQAVAPGVAIVTSDTEAELAALLQELGLDLGDPAGPPEEETDEQKRGRLDIRLNRLLGRVRRERAAIAANQAVRDDQAAEADLWLRRVNREPERVIAFLEPVLREAFSDYPLPGKARSRALPAGICGFRKVAGTKRVTDMAAAVAFARRHGIEVREEVQVSRITEWQRGEDVDERTGEVVPRALPDFVEISGAGDRFYFETA